jgi:hypothetical protein
MRLVIHAPDAEPYDLDSYTIAEAIEAEAATIAADADAELLADGTDSEREELRLRVIDEATAALGTGPGYTYTDPTGVRWTLDEG